MLVFSAESASPLLLNQSVRMSFTACASSWFSQNTQKSSAYLTTARLLSSSPRFRCFIPRASSIPCSAILASKGLITPPTMLQTLGNFFRGRLWCLRRRIDAEHDPDLLLVNLNALHQRPNDLAAR